MTNIALMNTPRKISTRYHFTALALGGISILLFGVAAKLLQQEYRIAVNPRVMGRIERTWIVPRQHGAHARVADLIFMAPHAGKPINCHAENLAIGDGTFDAKVGDSIELSPIPDSCDRPYVINIQPPTWLDRTLISIIASAGFCFALFTWGALSDAGSLAGSWFRRALDIES